MIGLLHTRTQFDEPLGPWQGGLRRAQCVWWRNQLARGEIEPAAGAGDHRAPLAIGVREFIAKHEAAAVSGRTSPLSLFDRRVVGDVHEYRLDALDDFPVLLRVIGNFLPFRI
jgi:hypothetical protein